MITDRREIEQRVIAAADLVERTGARQFQIGYLHDDETAERAAWYAHAQFRGGRIMVENHRGPAEAAEALAERLLSGARCSCGKLVALSDVGAFAFKRAVMADGTEFTAEQARTAGLCRWKRDGDRWVSGCGLRGAR